MHLLSNDLNRNFSTDERRAKISEEEIEECTENRIDGSLSPDKWDDIEGYYKPIIGQSHRSYYLFGCCTTSSTPYLILQ